MPTGRDFRRVSRTTIVPGKVGGVQKKIRECNLPNRSGSCHLHHGVGDFSGPGVRRYGYLRPKPDGPEQVYCGPTELWAATSPRQCSSGYADLGDSGSLPGVGESFGTEEGSSPGTDLDRGHSGVSGDSRESTLFRENSLRTVGCPEVESRIPVPVASVVQSDIVGPREAGSGCNQDVPPGIMPSLIARLLWAAQEDNPAEVKVPPNTRARRPSVALDAGTPGRNQLAGVFSCGRPGHGVNRCSRVDTSFPFLSRGWSVDIRDGQYRAEWQGGSMARSPRDGPGRRVGLPDHR